MSCDFDKFRVDGNLRKLRNTSTARFCRCTILGIYVTPICTFFSTQERFEVANTRIAPLFFLDTFFDWIRRWIARQGSRKVIAVVPLVYRWCTVTVARETPHSRCPPSVCNLKYLWYLLVVSNTWYVSGTCYLFLL